MSDLLKDMVEAVERIRQDYPDVPVRFDFSTDVWNALKAAVPHATSLSSALTGAAYPSGVPCFVDYGKREGEWGPVFRIAVPAPWFGPSPLEREQ